MVVEISLAPGLLEEHEMGCEGAIPIPCAWGWRFFEDDAAACHICRSPVVICGPRSDTGGRLWRANT